MMQHRFKFLLWFVVVAVTGFTIGQYSDLRANNANDQASYRLLSLLGEAFERVRGNYVEDIDDEVLIEGAIRGMMSSLDPYSDYLDATHYGDMQDRTRGQFGGLGIEVTQDDSGYVRVVSPIDDTPAAKAGIITDDLITHIDGEDVTELNLTQAVEKMRGKVNTTIELDVLRGDNEHLQFTLKRQFITVRSVRTRLVGDAEDIGYLRITNFNKNTGYSVAREIERLDDLGNVRGFIIDLRNNPGGLLDEAVAISNGFLERGEIVSIRGRSNKSIQRFQAQEGDWIDGRPLVVLINRGSASASEIVGGALQDHARATLLGTTSFGKGSVQTIIPLQANKAALKLTTQYYYTPSGRSITKVGLTPDIEVESLPLITNADGSISPPERDVQLDRAIELLLQES